ncbi:hypothetical protein PQX77_021026 [Marasmius sp. AFHP31]|nr:hypothetical protein PQX77_021026 [Marasmius sp. AFHP31]
MPTLFDSCQQRGQQIIENIEPSPLPLPLENLLNTNDPPSSVNIPDFEIHTLIESQSHESKLALVSLESEIADLRAKVDVLLKRHTATKRRLDRCNAIREPVRRVPNDILIYIFKLYVDSDIKGITLEDNCKLFFPGTKEVGMFDTTKAPWILSFVCHRWRDLALSIPFLWTSITVDLDKSNFSTNDNATAVIGSLKLQLARCGNQRLSVSFNHGNKNHHRSDEVIEVLFSRAAQWSRARLRMLPSLGLGSYGFERYEGMFQQLTELHFHFHASAEPQQYEPITRLFKDAPNLNKLFFRGSGRICSDSSTLQHLHFPFDQLVHFECQHSREMGGKGCNDLSHRLILEKFRQSDKLQVVRMACCSFLRSVIGQSPNEALSLSSIHTFDLRLSAVRLDPPLLAQLTLPSLKRLNLRSLSRWDAGYAIQFLERSDCEIEEFGLLELSSPWRSEHIARVLRAAGPLVSSLSLGFKGIQRHRHTREGPLFAELGTPWDGPDSETTLLLPRLRRLTLCEVDIDWAHKVISARRTREISSGDLRDTRIESLVVQVEGGMCGIPGAGYGQVLRYCFSEGIAFKVQA